MLCGPGLQHPCCKAPMKYPGFLMLFCVHLMAVRASIILILWGQEGVISELKQAWGSVPSSDYNMPFVRFCLQSEWLWF